jgi:hypothetical protein
MAFYVRIVKTAEDGHSATYSQDDWALLRIPSAAVTWDYQRQHPEMSTATISSEPQRS